MGDIQDIVALWKRARRRNEPVYLATVVHVEGSSYRKPGARMLVTGTGERAGTVSGGCLEAEVSKKIGWLTADGPSLQKYSSSFDDDHEGVPYGLGCGGTIWILLERGDHATAVLEAYERALDRRIASVVLYSLQDPVGTAAILTGAELNDTSLLPGFHSVSSLPLREARTAYESQRSLAVTTSADASWPAFLCVPILPPPRLFIFGAGDDARPIARFACELGWEVQVADGRSHLLRAERFPGVHELRQLVYTPREESPLLPHLTLRNPPAFEGADLAVVLTHSYEQDRAILEVLLPASLRYMGLLGPLHRTRRLIASLAPILRLDEAACLARLRAPIGLDIGTEDPASIALSVIAEIQAELMGRTVHMTRAGVDTAVHRDLAPVAPQGATRHAELPRPSQV